MTQGDLVIEYSEALDMYVGAFGWLDVLLAHTSEAIRRYGSREFDDSCSRAQEAAMLMVEEERQMKANDQTVDKLMKIYGDLSGARVEGEAPRVAANIKEVFGTPKAKTYSNVKLLVTRDAVEAVNISAKSRGSGLAEEEVEQEQRARGDLVALEELEAFRKEVRLHVFLDDDGSGHFICPNCDSVFSDRCRTCGKTREELLGGAQVLKSDRAIAVRGSGPVSG